MSPFHEERPLQWKDLQHLKRLLLLLKPFIPHLILSLLLIILSKMLVLSGPYLLKLGIDHGIIADHLNKLWLFTSLFLSVLLMDLGFTFFHTWLLTWIGQKVMYNLRENLFAHVEELSLSFFEKNPVGRLVTRVTTDINALSELFSGGVVTIFGDLFLIVGIIIIMLKLNIILAMLTLCSLPFLLMGTVVFRKKARQSFSEIRIKLARLNAYTQEVLSGIKVIKLFHSQEDTLGHFGKINDQYRQSYLQVIGHYAWYLPLVEITSAVSLILILYYAAQTIEKNILSYGTLVAFMSYVNYFFHPIRDLAEKYNVLQSALSASERIFQLFDTQDRIPMMSAAKTGLGPLQTIEFKNVSFRYDLKNWVLKNINFKISRGEKWGLVGPTGSGKTTIIKLLNRLYDTTEGEISINGENIKNIAREELKSVIGTVWQDSYIFTDTVLENIRLWNSGHALAQIEKHLKNLQIQNLLLRNEKTYHYILQEKGSTLSGGERQLISFTRIVVQDPQLFILDEATANIDLQTESKIQEILNYIIRDRSALIIAHRLSTIQRVDRILVLNHGEIIEQGSHHQLIRHPGLYQKLYHLQRLNQKFHPKTSLAAIEPTA